MPSYKLLYFNARGRAENSRLLFALAKVNYEDYRFKDNEEFVKMQPELPTSQVPALIIDGKDTLCQGHAIERYLAEQFGYVAKTPINRARVNMVVDTVEDLLQVFFGIHMEKDETKKAELRKTAETEKVPRFLKNFEKMLTENKSSDKYIVGDSITLADINLANLMDQTQKNAKKEGKDALSHFPKLKAHTERIHAIPEIKSWVAKRPESEF